MTKIIIAMRVGFFQESLIMMEAISFQGDVGTITAKFKNPYRRKVCMLTRVKIFKSCQHTAENATKLLLFYFLMAHCCKQLRATGLPREESIPHAAQVGIFSLVRIRSGRKDTGWMFVLVFWVFLGFY